MDVWPSKHEDRTPTHGYEPTREAAMAAFAKKLAAGVAPMTDHHGEPAPLIPFRGQADNS